MSIRSFMLLLCEQVLAFVKGGSHMEGSKGKMRALPKQNRAVLRIEQILAAAADTFAEFGYDNATTNEIARRANASIGALYRFFPDKKAIFVALSQSYLDKVGRLMATELLPKISAEPEQVVACCLELCDQFLASEPAFGAVFVYSDASPELKEIDRQMKRSVANIFAGLLRQRTPSLPQPKSELIARVCVELSAAYFRLSLSEPEITPAERKVEFCELISAYLNLHL